MTKQTEKREGRRGGQKGKKKKKKKYKKKDNLGEKRKLPLIQPFGTADRAERDGVLIASPVVAVVSRLVDLRLLLNGGVLTALSRATLREAIIETIQIKNTLQLLTI